MKNHRILWVGQLSAERERPRGTADKMTYRIIKRADSGELHVEHQFKDALDDLCWRRLTGIFTIEVLEQALEEIESRRARIE